MRSVPAYRRLADDLRARVAAGEFPPGGPLPSRAELAAGYGVGSNVAAAAVRLLVSEGLAQGRAGRGVFVREPRTTATMVRGWSPERVAGRLAVAPGGTPEHVSDGCTATRVLAGATGLTADPDPREGGTARSLRGAPDSATEAATSAVAGRLTLTIGDPVIRSRYLLHSDELPAMLCVSWEPLGITGGTPVSLPGAGPVAGGSVVARMAYIGIRVTRVTETVSARPGTAAEVAALDLAEGAVVAAIERTYYSGDRPLETADLVVPGERFRLAYEIPAPPARDTP
ncbi:GntR family transcriptional regulator [Streptomyces bohaiensis]|uniref:GntR family transcriptional regulator n=1 Tax=Streptomyces bohaiensis TaxID=1431344 RepID=UPI003B7CAB0F